MGKRLRQAHLSRLLSALLALLLLWPPLPAFAGEYDPAHPENLEARNLRASSAIVIEQSSGRVLFEKNADE
ncbi:MAG TPA: hypothetical protein PLA31_08900, partial [Clostridia bacterium]|nr:hypothetical protein [Clostridia bacterium]